MSDVLDIDKLAGLLTPPPPENEWIAALREAAEVTVRVSRYAVAGEAHAISEPGMDAFVFGEKRDTGRIMVVCHEKDAGRVRRIVDAVRAPFGFRAPEPEEGENGS